MKYIKSQKYDGYIIYKIQYIYISKKNYIKYTKLKKEYGNYEDLLPKYELDYE